VSSYRALVTVFGVVAAGLGVAIIIETALFGGGVGYVIGLLFIAVGLGRLYLLYRRTGS
jgi:hypothetical protein